MEIFFIRHGGKEIKTANFLSGLELDKKETAILSSRETEAVEFAKTIRDLFKFRIRQYGWLSFNGPCGNGNLDDQIRHKISNLCQKGTKNIIIVTDEKEIEKTLNSYYTLFNPKKTRFDTVVEKGSIHLVRTLDCPDRGQKVEKIFTTP